MVEKIVKRETSKNQSIGQNFSGWNWIQQKENMIQELQELFGKSLVKSYTLIKRDKKRMVDSS